MSRYKCIILQHDAHNAITQIYILSVVIRVYIILYIITICIGTFNILSVGLSLSYTHDDDDGRGLT